MKKDVNEIIRKKIVRLFEILNKPNHKEEYNKILDDIQRLWELELNAPSPESIIKKNKPDLSNRDRYIRRKK